jgi:hypothetical protein
VFQIAMFVQSIFTLTELVSIVQEPLFKIAGQISNSQFFKGFNVKSTFKVVVVLL